MTLRTWLLLAIALAVCGWWLAPQARPAPAVATATHGAAGLPCPPPPRVAAGAAPLQSAVPAAVAAFRLPAATLWPMAGFSVEARVLSRADYASGREAALSPTDLALGWERMGDDDVLARLDITQSGRWYRYRWQGASPLPPMEIVRSSANVHVIPADASASAALARVRTGERVRIEGWLVEAVAPDGWRWRSSLSRDDSGDGSCEVVYACSISVE